MNKCKKIYLITYHLAKHYDNGDVVRCDATKKDKVCYRRLGSAIKACELLYSVDSCVQAPYKCHRCGYFHTTTVNINWKPASIGPCYNITEIARKLILETNGDTPICSRRLLESLQLSPESRRRALVKLESRGLIIRNTETTVMIKDRIGLLTIAVDGCHYWYK